jgi:predicted MFS family arabinose efflux permease
MVFGAAVLLGWLVIPVLLRRRRAGLVCLLVAGLFLAACGVTAWHGRPAATVVVFGLFAVGWLVAAVFAGRRRARHAGLDVETKLDDETEAKNAAGMNDNRDKRVD